ncbi:MAG: MEKHLA domain-containing protein [Candidatus Omnitrophica bacterium]|nr:MEKHLA domain-containing protein [Candidatus Omnitrophota bacterium]
MMESYRRVLGEDLFAGIDLTADPTSAAKALFEAPFVLASSDAAPDPILTYGNRRALELWELDWPSLTSLPGRHTAEAPERDERERFLSEVRANGFVRNYSGIRVTRTGRRFRIRNAVVWNLTNANGRFAGQAARFADWDWL